MAGLVIWVSRHVKCPTVSKVASRSGPQAASQPEAPQEQSSILVPSQVTPQEPNLLKDLFPPLKLYLILPLLQPPRGLHVDPLRSNHVQASSHGQLSVPPYWSIVGADSYFTGTNQGHSYGAMVTILDSIGAQAITLRHLHAFLNLKGESPGVGGDKFMLVWRRKLPFPQLLLGLRSISLLEGSLTIKAGTLATS
ncbi:hypothetical protein B0H11DRAFT_1916959 [Mycena galericulata]|nr:hypothetical protein B0H11DRAFT_1916959 [Mycena galericulata]